MTEPGIGTNRYAYSFDDPVNMRDPGGNAIDTGEESWLDRQIRIGRKRRALAEELDVDVRAVRLGSADGTYNVGKETFSVSGAYDVAMGINGGGSCGARCGSGGLPAAKPKTKNSNQPTIQQHRTHHNSRVDELRSRYEAKGYEVRTEVTFSVAGRSARVDLAIFKNGRLVRVVDVKTGNATLSSGQRVVYPRIADESARPRGQKAQDGGLNPNLTLSGAGHLAIVRALRLRGLMR